MCQYQYEKRRSLVRFGFTVVVRDATLWADQLVFRLQFEGRLPCLKGAQSHHYHRVNNVGTGYSFVDPNIEPCSDLAARKEIRKRYHRSRKVGHTWLYRNDAVLIHVLEVSKEK